MKKVALLIGVSEYTSGLNPLPAALNDVDAMESILNNPEMGGFDEVKILRNPIAQEMQIEIALLFKNRTRDDLIFFYFSGHGIRDDKGNFYFATRDTQKELVVATAIPARFIHDVMNGSRAERQAIILDSCNSEAFNPEYQAKSASAVDFQEQLGAKGRVVLASSAFSEYSYERKGDRLSVYTQHLVDGITTGKADIDRDGYISMQDLHDYAGNCLRDSDVEMNPKISILKGEGHKVIVSSVKAVDDSQYYRDALKDILKQCNGDISASDNFRLMQLREKYGLSSEAAEQYQEAAMKPYREREKNIKLFRSALTEVIFYGNETDQQKDIKLSQTRKNYANVLLIEDLDNVEMEVKEMYKSRSVRNAGIEVDDTTLSPLSQASEPQNRLSSVKIESVDTSRGFLVMKPWMRLCGGAVALCGTFLAGYFISQPRQLPEDGPLRASRSELNLPSNSGVVSLSGKPSERENVDPSVDENYKVNQAHLDLATSGMKSDTWGQWEQAISHATQALKAESKLQVDQAKEIIAETKAKMADEVSRMEEVRRTESVTPIQQPATITEVKPQPSTQTEEKPPSGLSKADCLDIEEKYQQLDPSTMDKLEVPGNTIREQCNNLGVVINQ
jgi:hypothetical protein